MTKDQKRYGLLSLVSLAAYAWVGYQYYTIEHTAHAFGTVCMFKNVTGIPCPSCGTTRAVLCLLHGDVSGALLTNPLGLVAALVMVVLPVWLLVDAITGSRSLTRWYEYAEIKLKTKKLLYLPLILLVMVNWGWNIFKDL